MRDPVLRALPLLALVGLLGSAPVAPVAGAEPSPGQALAPLTSVVTVEGTSSLHDWAVTAKGLRGSLTLPVGFLDGRPAAGPAATFSLRANALRSDHDRMNRIMWEALLAAEHPELTFELQTARLLTGEGASGTRVEVKGPLTVAGVTRVVTVAFGIRRDGARLVATGELPLKMTDFGIEPPTAMMGAVRTGDAVTVKIETTLAPSP